MFLRIFILLEFCLAVHAACQEAKAKALPEMVWKPIYQGIAQSEFTLEEPRDVRGFVLRIDLKADGIEFLATPGNGSREGETDGLKTSTFLTTYHLQAAINAAPFAPVRHVENEPEDISGLAVSEGKVVSNWQKGDPFPALLITKKNHARIISPGAKHDDAWNAACGFKIVLKNGEPQPSDDVLHPRTAAGISPDGRHLIWLVVDGRQLRWSNGATTHELGIWLKELGSSEGISLDGGGTSTLVTADAKGKAQVANRPIHGGFPGLERVSASHLGVRAKPLQTAKNQDK